MESRWAELRENELAGRKERTKEWLKEKKMGRMMGRRWEMKKERRKERQMGRRRELPLEGESERMLGWLKDFRSGRVLGGGTGIGMDGSTVTQREQQLGKMLAKWREKK
jgi:hypothetical protein